MKKTIESMNRAITSTEKETVSKKLTKVHDQMASQANSYQI